MKREDGIEVTYRNGRYWAYDGDTLVASGSIDHVNEVISEYVEAGRPSGANKSIRTCFLVTVAIIAVVITVIIALKINNSASAQGSDTQSVLQPVEQPIQSGKVEQPIVEQSSASGTVNSEDLAFIQQALNQRSVPSIDEPTCKLQVAGGMQNKWENGICYIRGPQDPPDVWVAIGIEYPAFSCERSLSGVAGSYNETSQTCTVAFNGTTSQWTWTGSGWQQK